METEKHKLGGRIDAFGWGLFFIMLGLLWMLPAGSVPETTWLIGLGLILLGVNYAKHQNSIPTSRFMIIIGSLALLGGISGFFGLQLPFAAIFFLLIGGSILYDLITKKDEH